MISLSGIIVTVVTYQQQCRYTSKKNNRFQNMAMFFFMTTHVYEPLIKSKRCFKLKKRLHVNYQQCAITHFFPFHDVS